MRLITLRNWPVGRKIGLILSIFIIASLLISLLTVTITPSEAYDASLESITLQTDSLAEIIIEESKKSETEIFHGIKSIIEDNPSEGLNFRFYQSIFIHFFQFVLLGLAFGYFFLSKGFKGIDLSNKAPILFFASIFMAINIPSIGADAIMLNELLGLDKLQAYLFDTDELADLKQMTTQYAFLFPNENRGYLISWIGLALFPALGEEILFRGVLMKLFTKFFKSVHNSIAFTALLFALMHLNLTYFFYYFVLGVVLGYMYYWGRNLLFPIIVHLINNSFVLLSYYMITMIPAEEIPPSDDTLSGQGIMSYFTVALILLVFYMNYKRYQDSKFLIK